ncbi:Vgb family protein [Mycolicibacterium palauense]|uniref:Vgb family protein n=1 Tax=Mycolicibacterium palauense TaxID=2034511 RepID=UPI000BFF17D4|nr:hypothetical protein [Mycolicibacterium palauense]
MTTIRVFGDRALDGPSGVIAAAGDVWFTSIGNHRVGRVRDGRIETFADPANRVRLPANIFPGGDGRVWWVNSSTDTVGCLYTASGTVGVVEPPLGSPRAWTQTADGRLWLSTREPAGLWSFDPADPSGSARHVTHERLREPDGVWAGVDGAVWIADTAANMLAGYHPATGRWRFAGGPPQVDGPFDIKAGPDDGNLWFTNKAGNTIGCLTLSGDPAQE